MDPRFKRYGFISETALEKTKHSLISQVAAMIITQENSTSVKQKSQNQNNQECSGSNEKTTSLSIWSDFDQKVNYVV